MDSISVLWICIAAVFIVGFIADIFEAKYKYQNKNNENKPGSVCGSSKNNSTKNNDN